MLIMRPPLPHKKTCAGCRKKFRPSSRHRYCPACRSSRAKKPCPQCGKPRQQRSATCSSCCPRSGPRSGSWKGGRPRHTDGYVYVKVPAHPRANSRGYIFEHIVNLEKKIGRCLLPGENVHHRNGLKGDNRPRNLELWCRPQPSGIRAKDALCWAKEVLERYEPIEHLL